MEPLLSIQLFEHLPSYLPEATLKCDYQIDAIPQDELLAIEASVMWYTEGKGDEDLGVHFFERRLPADADDGNLLALRSFESKLPNSPLSYRGKLVQIRWCVRLRAFLSNGKESTLDHPFHLGPIE
jgi:hypothetical protein